MSSIDTLRDGYRRFHAGPARDPDFWRERAEGQSPHTLVISCSDSRVDPGAIFSADAGDIFVLRNVAAIVPPRDEGGAHDATMAAIEFAVTQLKVAEVLVMGHESCGGCKAALGGLFAGAEPGAGGYVRGWVDLLDAARGRVIEAYGADAQTEMEREAVRQSLANLRTYAFVTDAEAAGTLTLRGAWFGIGEARLELLDPGSDRFEAA